MKTPDSTTAESDAATAREAANRLGLEKSPYLLQHADNPVEWYPWSEEAFRVAREEDKPVFLSIGYSTCHWCHVMAHESFEDADVAELLNEHFVSVKVDREERPDVDSLYMSVCQALTGGGGWPLTVFLTPDKEPFFAGTYFPKEGRGGRMGMTELLPRVAELWENQRERVRESGREILEAVRRGATEGAGELLDASVTGRAYETLASRFDPNRGGFGREPKFPSPHNLLFLLRHHDRTGDEEALEMVETTLRWMRRGGIWDHVGHGFHRYSTDARWLLPHFEKMLYDQALMALAYLETYQVTGAEDYARVAREIFTYVLRDLRDEGGAFHAAEDADSEGGEGTFYVWTRTELEERLGPDDYRLVKEIFGVQDRGNFAEEATGRRTGENILHRNRSLAEEAAERDMEPPRLRERLEAVRERLFEAREERPRPHRDDKVLTDWNGLMIAALARGSHVLDDAELLDAAREAAEFLLSTLREDGAGSPSDSPSEGGGGRLLHRWRDGEAAVPATADDYAFLTWGLMELYQATLEPAWLERAVSLDGEFVERCWDDEGGGFWIAGEDVDDVPVRQKEVSDGALPSANSVAHWNARRLAHMTGRSELEERADRIERAFGSRVRRAPAGHTMLLSGVDFRLGEPAEVVVAGRPGADDVRGMLDRLREDYRPRAVYLLRPDGGEDLERLAAVAPFVREQEPLDGKATAYVCRGFSCERPTTDPEEARRLLAGEETGASAAQAGDPEPPGE